MRRLPTETTGNRLGSLLELGLANGNEMLDVLDWLVKHAQWIERSLGNRQLKGATLTLCDITSSYLAGQPFPLPPRRQEGQVQIVFGLLCASDSCPFAVEVFPGNTGDPTTVAQQVAK